MGKIIFADVLRGFKMSLIIPNHVNHWIELTERCNEAVDEHVGHVEPEGHAADRHLQTDAGGEDQFVRGHGRHQFPHVQRSVFQTDGQSFEDRVQRQAQDDQESVQRCRLRCMVAMVVILVRVILVLRVILAHRSVVSTSITFRINSIKI